MAYYPEHRNYFLIIENLTESEYDPNNDTHLDPDMSPTGDYVRMVTAVHIESDDKYNDVIEDVATSAAEDGFEILSMDEAGNSETWKFVRAELDLDE